VDYRENPRGCCGKGLRRRGEPPFSDLSGFFQRAFSIPSTFYPPSPVFHPASALSVDVLTRPGPLRASVRPAAKAGELAATSQFRGTPANSAEKDLIQA
jgi:hypothetical protein